jgi:hypothetical protein
MCVVVLSIKKSKKTTEFNPYAKSFIFLTNDSLCIFPMIVFVQFLRFLSVYNTFIVLFTAVYMLMLLVPWLRRHETCNDAGWESLFKNNCKVHVSFKIQ